MRLKYNDTLDIATAGTSRASKWANKRTEWKDLVDDLSHTERTAETLKQYFSYTKEKQDKIKDVGGFVGGYLKGGVRRNGHVDFRQIVSLDVDFGGVEVWESFVVLEAAGVMYSTHKHTPEVPRLRIVFPLDRKVNADEYEAIARMVAYWLGIDHFDDTTYQPTRMMYYPSTAKDAEYLFEYTDAPFMSADEVLDEYHDWTDPTTWPVSSRVSDKVKHDRGLKMEDPTEKEGVVGAFCRAFTIGEAVAEFLDDVYEPADDMGPGRYSFVGGSTSGGLVVYDDLIAHSHHSTDPAGGRSCNAFDLVRLHKFGDLDDGREVKDITRLPSFKAMAEFSNKLKEVKREALKRRASSADDYDVMEEEAREAADVADWVGDLEMEGKTDRAKSTIANVRLILENDENLKGCLGYNEFEQRETAVLALPWDRKIDKYPRPLDDADDAQIRAYLESAYGITGTRQINDAMVIVLRKYKYHPVREYLDAQQWDGAERLDELFINCLGAADNSYIRAVTRKAFVAAVARVYRPGIKFDYCTVIVGDQGIGKSTTLARMGGAWFSDSVPELTGTKALESLQGSWILELGEMAAYRKADVEAVKHFISKTEDRFRVAYGKRVEHFPRRCVFFATTNEEDFLRDVTGNRRFWIINTKGGKPFVDFHDYLDEETVGQLWAEAKHYFENGEALYLDDKKLERHARLIQDSHLEKDERAGIIGDYLDRALPNDWYTLDTYQRRDWLSDDKAEGTEERTRVCIYEIWAECLMKDINSITRRDSFEIGRILKSFRSWAATGDNFRFGAYGSQKAYVKV